MLRQLPAVSDARLLVSASTADDAAVFQLDRHRALVQTVDFFTPIVDDPFTYGQIAAANSLSDVFAMGGRPVTALNVVGVPADRVPPTVVARILKGGAAKVAEAGCLLVGGHTIQNPEPLYGLAVTGFVHPRRVITNAAARAGDALVLTKPLGTGIIATGIKRGLAPAALARRAVAAMRRLNAVGAPLGESGLVRAGTDVTGFGLLGHLGALCQASGVGAELFAAKVPVLGRGIWDLVAKDCVPGGTRRNLLAAEAWTRFEAGVTPAQRLILADAQTSGGLLLCVAERRLTAVLRLLAEQRAICAAVIGRILRAEKPVIRVRC